jgi:hypothetical protein
MNFAGYIQTISDGEWHFNCFDMNIMLKGYFGSSVSSSQLIITSVWKQILIDDDEKNVESKF